MLKSEKEAWESLPRHLREMFKYKYPMWVSTGIIGLPYRVVSSQDEVISGMETPLYPSYYGLVLHEIGMHFLTGLYEKQVRMLNPSLDVHSRWSFRCDVMPSGDCSVSSSGEGITFDGYGSTNMIAALNWAVAVVDEWKAEFMPGLQDIDLSDAGKDCFIDDLDRASISVSSSWQFQEKKWFPFIDDAGFECIRNDRHYSNSRDSNGLVHVGKIELREGIYELYYSPLEKGDDEVLKDCSTMPHYDYLDRTFYELGRHLPVGKAYRVTVDDPNEVGDLYLGSVSHQFDSFLTSSDLGKALEEVLNSPASVSMGSLVVTEECSICDEDVSGKIEETE